MDMLVINFFLYRIGVRNFVRFENAKRKLKRKKV
jgi:hypothetical protein